MTQMYIKLTQDVHLNDTDVHSTDIDVHLTDTDVHSTDYLNERGHRDVKGVIERR